MDKIKKVLDLGEVEVIETLGSDLTVVNAARVSFGKKKTEIDESDKKLIRYLIKNKHTSPFRHLFVQYRIKAPEFVLRQLFRHLVGIEATSTYPTKDMAWNEISQRYTKVTEYYIPNDWRKQSSDNKQASAGNLDSLTNYVAGDIFKEHMKLTMESYNDLINLGVAKEQARILLPLNVYTEVYWTASFQAIMNFLELRDHEHSQWEIREYAKAMKLIMEDIFPIITEIWFKKKEENDI